MVFSDRIEKICQEHNRIKACKEECERDYDKLIFEAEEQTINYCLGTLGISCVRSNGYITAFDYLGGFREVAS